MNRLPDFLIIGAARSGTTAIYRALKAHPQIFMSEVKEPNFFAFEGQRLDVQGPGAEFINNSVTRLDDYTALFAKAPPGATLGEASPLYLHVAGTAPRIAARIPEARLIAILRNPIEQAFSHYLYARANMIEPLDSFEAALDAEPERAAQGWQPLFQYSRFPRYGEQLARFFDHFPRERIKIALYEELADTPARLLADIQRFIGVDAGAETRVPRANPGGVPRNAALQRLLMRPNLITKVAGAVMPAGFRRKWRDRIASGNIAQPEMSAAARARLTERLHDDIERLQTMIGKDLRPWLQFGIVQRE